MGFVYECVFLRGGEKKRIFEILNCCFSLLNFGWFPWKLVSLLLCSLQFFREAKSALSIFSSRFGSKPQSPSVGTGQAAAPGVRSCPPEIPSLISRKARVRTRPCVDPTALPASPQGSGLFYQGPSSPGACWKPRPIPHGQQEV